MRMTEYESRKAAYGLTGLETEQRAEIEQLRSELLAAQKEIERLHLRNVDLLLAHAIEVSRTNAQDKDNPA